MHHPEPGFAEQNPMDWWQAVCKTTKSVLKKADVDPKDVVGITFSSLMQNLVPVNKSGEILHPAITWLDNRGSQIMRDKL